MQTAETINIFENHEALEQGIRTTKSQIQELDSLDEGYPEILGELTSTLNELTAALMDLRGE